MSATAFPGLAHIQPQVALPSGSCGLVEKFPMFPCQSQLSHMLVGAATLPNMVCSHNPCPFPTFMCAGRCCGLAHPVTTLALLSVGEFRGHIWLGASPLPALMQASRCYSPTRVSPQIPYCICSRQCSLMYLWVLRPSPCTSSSYSAKPFQADFPALAYMCW